MIPKTRSEVVSDTVKLVSEKIPIPSQSLDDHLKQAVHDILTIIKNPQKTTLPLLHYNDSTAHAIKQTATLIQRAVELPIEKPKIKDVVNFPRVPRELINKHINAIPPLSVDRYNNTPVYEALHKLQNSRLVGSMPPPKTPPLAIPTPKGKFNPNPFEPPSLPPMKDDSFYLSPHNNVRLPHMPIGAQAPSLFHMFDDLGNKLNIDKLIKGPNAETWLQSLDNELGRLADGIPNKINGTNTIAFIKKNTIPSNKQVTYSNMVCDYRPLKQEKYRVRLTIGGDRLSYEKETASPAANLLETKLLVNSVISESKLGARFASLDIKDFFLQTALKEKEYMRIHKKYFSKQFIELYQLEDRINDDGYVYCEILKGMYGLKQAAILAYQQLKKRLEEGGYYHVENTAGLWKHKTRKTTLALCVDDFGVKYFNDDDLTHLIKTLQKNYVISVDKTGQNYCGLTFNWNYTQQYVDVSMPGYIPKALKKFNHIPPKTKQYAPSTWPQREYGKSPQLATAYDDTELLRTKGDVRDIQCKVGTFLYYARAVDPTILPALNKISRRQSNPSVGTKKALDMLMDYLSTYPSARLRYHATDMQLHIESDAAYLVLPGAKSRIAGHYKLSNFYNNNLFNSPIHTECKTIRHVVCSAAEAETHGLFQNCQNAIAIRQALEGLGHKQERTIVKTDNTTAEGFCKKTMREKKSKTWDMRYNWLRDEVVKKQFKIIWDKGVNNMGDYFTKDHPPTVHKEKRKDYILAGYNITEILKSRLEKAYRKLT